MQLKRKFESLYQKYNHRRYVHPDPIEFLYDYDRLKDREIVGFIASALAYGRVGHIIKSVSRVLRVMGPSPKQYLQDVSWQGLRNGLAGFKHRFATGDALAGLLYGAAMVIEQHGSLHSAFLAGYRDTDENMLPALVGFVDMILAAAPLDPGHLLPVPDRGSACKRLNLFLRWMIRKDRVDPGGWQDIPKKKLIIPLDTHMLRLGRDLGFTVRKQGNMITALEITNRFKELVPSDPVRYDFMLTRLGIWGKTENTVFS